MLAAAPGESLKFDHLDEEAPARSPAPATTGAKPLPVQGVEWLEQLAGSPIEETRGKLTFDDSIWKSPGRRDPELP
ncbi:MAG TPA: hypothetical protein VJA16_16165 [Thermoanaerobaculia bacterium]